MEYPLISICIPTYNGEKFLRECLDSAVGQSYQNIEIIIADDSSADQTFSLAGMYAARDVRIKLFKNEQNLGLVGNWNRCLEVATGAWIKFLFQDDYLAPDCIEVMVNAISADDRMIVSQRRFISDAPEKENIPDNIITFKKLDIVSTVPVFVGPGKIASFAAKYICLNFIGEPTVIMFRKDMIGELGTFNPDLIQICDLEYFLRVASHYGLKYIPQQLTYFRLHKESTSASNVAKRFFLINNTDPLIVVHELLYGSLFHRFRKNLDTLQKIRLKLFFATRVYEATQAVAHTTIENRHIFDSFANKYPFIRTFSKGNIFTYTLLKLVQIKRFIKKRK